MSSQLSTSLQSSSPPFQVEGGGEPFNHDPDYNTQVLPGSLLNSFSPRCTSSWSEWPNKWVMGRALIYRWRSSGRSRCSRSSGSISRSSGSISSSSGSISRSSGSISRSSDTNHTPLQGAGAACALQLSGHLGELVPCLRSSASLMK